MPREEACLGGNTARRRFTTSSTHSSWVLIESKYEIAKSTNPPFLGKRLISGLAVLNLLEVGILYE